MHHSNGKPPERDDTAFYGLTPRAVLTDGALSMTARVLYGLLDSRQTSASRVRLTQRLLADELGVSVRTVGAALAELRAAGWLQAGRTGRSSSYAVLNPARSERAARKATKPSAATASPQPAATVNTAATAELSALLRSDRSVLVDLTTARSRAALQAAQSRGWTLQQIADELNVTSLTTAKKPGAVLATRLQQLAEKPSPQQLTARQDEQRRDERELQQLVDSGALACEHGETRGSTACALCRRSAADVAVGIAAALAPDQSGPDYRAREALADLVTAADPPIDEALEQLVEELAGGFTFAALPKSRRTGVMRRSVS